MRQNTPPPRIEKDQMRHGYRKLFQGGEFGGTQLQFAQRRCTQILPNKYRCKCQTARIFRQRPFLSAVPTQFQFLYNNLYTDYGYIYTTAKYCNGSFKKKKITYVKTYTIYSITEITWQYCVRSNTTNRRPLHFAWRLFILHEFENDARRTTVDVDRFSSQNYRSIRELMWITCIYSEK